jgi:hypothetical protein
MYLVLACLTVVPTFPVGFWLLAKVPGIFRPGARVFGGGFWRCLAAIVAEPFVGGHWHWTGVLMIQRLLIVFISVFVKNEMGVSIGMMAVCLFFLVLQLLVRPYKTGWVNVLQACASMCLTGISMLDSSSRILDSAGVDVSGTPLAPLLLETNRWTLALLFMPAAMWVCFVLREMLVAESNAHEELTHALQTHADMEAKIAAVQATNTDLQATNTDLQATNTDLQATNTDLQATNSDLQSAIADMTAKIKTLEAKCTGKNATPEMKTAALQNQASARPFETLQCYSS